MLWTILRSVLFASLLLVPPQSQLDGSIQAVVVSHLNVAWEGKAAPIGKNHSVTAGHVVLVPVTMPSNVVMLLPFPKGDITVEGKPAKVLTTTRDDLTAILLKTTHENVFWYETDEISLEEAFVVTKEGLVEVLVIDLKEQAFFGWRPVPGESGSPILQKRGDKYVLTGLVIAKICDGCIDCKIEWDCHCPKGGRYSRITLRLI